MTTSALRLPRSVRSRSSALGLAGGGLAAFLALLPVLAGGCTRSVFEYEGEVPMREPPASYRQWFSEVVACADRQDLDTAGRFAAMQWWTAERIRYTDSTNPERPRLYATWTYPHRIIVRRDQTGNEEVVKHELVHDILGMRGHDSPLFRDCAGN